MHGLRSALLAERITCGSTDGCSVVAYSGPAVVNSGELAIFGAFLAIGAGMTWMLAGPEAITKLRRNRAT